MRDDQHHTLQVRQPWGATVMTRSADRARPAHSAAVSAPTVSRSGAVMGRPGATHGAYGLRIDEGAPAITAHPGASPHTPRR
jgi:hypothetical protein